MGKKKKKNKKTKGLPIYNKRTLRKKITEILSENPKKIYNYKQISKRLEIKDDATRRLVVEILNELHEQDRIEEVSIGKYRCKARKNVFRGILDMSQKGHPIVRTEDEEEIFVHKADLNHALHGDTVEVYIYARRKGRIPEGEINKVIKRSKNTFVGRLEISKNFAFAIVDNKYMPYDIFIPKSNLNGAKNKEKVIIKVVEWPRGAKNPIGVVTRVLGKAGKHEVEMHAILAEFDLPATFSTRLEKAANSIKAGITDEEIAKRKDFRDITTFTIDPADAKDFDDALSVRYLENGNYEVGVHIADVTHYVEEGTALDKEAFERGTSVYLVDRVVPMLPENLSNNICSLRPNEDKLTFSAVFELDKDANVLKKWFGRTVINSDRRFNYEEAQQIIETGQGDLVKEILTLHSLAQKLRSRRFKNGSISFERSEVKFKLDEKGKPLSVYFKEPKDSNHLIEEFMLLANKHVAEFVGKTKNKERSKTFVYRVHDEPDLEKLNSFANFIRKFGYNINFESEKAISKSLNNLLEQVKGKGEEDVVQNLAIRSMAKAIYSTQNIGHYGLAFKYYTHFTSPIRRYPDMMVHRLLARYLAKGKSVSKQKYEKMCEHASDMEQRAVMAERMSVKYKQVEFMQDKIGQIFEGIISGLTEWGIYVEIIENKVEGMVALRDIEDDFYVYDEENFCITGHYSNRKYQIGDKVKIKVVRANLELKQLDFQLVI